MLKNWDLGSQGTDEMPVKKKPDLTGRAENGRNLDSGIPKIHLPYLKMSRYRPPSPLPARSVALSTARAGMLRPLKNPGIFRIPRCLK